VARPEEQTTELLKHLLHLDDRVDARICVAVKHGFREKLYFTAIDLPPSAARVLAAYTDQLSGGSQPASFTPGAAGPSAPAPPSRATDAVAAKQPRDACKSSARKFVGGSQGRARTFSVTAAHCTRVGRS
jgi:hypothetical protein